MKQWRWYIVLLLSVFAYRILVHGLLCDYARTHGAVGQLFHKENNWSHYVFKTRKRSVPPPPTAASAAIVAPAPGKETVDGFLLPAFTILFQNTFANVAHLSVWPLRSAPPSLPGKVFLKLCCLRR